MASNEIKTWRYLRLAIVTLVLGLAAAVIWEWHLAPHECLQQSISAYFYTPARGMFTGALIGIGVCLICIRGTTNAEDTALNLAGIFAPLVANTTGWMFTEVGRQPWVVQGLLKTTDGVSPLASSTLWASLIIFTLLYAVLAVVELWLVLRVVRGGPEPAPEPVGSSRSGDPLLPSLAY